MRVHVHPRKKKATLATLIAIVVSVNASVLKSETKEAVSPCNSKIVSDKLGEEKNLDQQKINYDGDQVWRVYKDNKIVEEVVRLKDEEGCT